jgi:hypothetical protein
MTWKRGHILAPSSRSGGILAGQGVARDLRSGIVSEARIVRPCAPELEGLMHKPKQLLLSEYA